MKSLFTYLFAFFTAVFMISCNCNYNNRGDQNGQSNPHDIQNKHGKQLNISILWDLSDRINPAIHEENIAKRDIAIIKYFADYYKADMDKRGAYLSRGKLKVFFSPNPSDANINSLASKLDIDLTNQNVKAKKTIYDNISLTFEQTAKEITDLTIKTSKWEGSDIYRFFKNDVADYCVSKDSSYRNILVLITDGYIYAPQSMGRVGNKSEYILPALLTSLHLRDNPEFKKTFKKNNCGLIATREDLNNLEVLVLGIDAESSHKDDEDVIKFYLQNWFSEMRVKRFEIYNTDISDNIKNKITNFLSYEK